MRHRSSVSNQFLNIVQVIEQCGDDLGGSPLIRDLVCKNLGYSTTTTVVARKIEITKKVKDYTLATAFIYGSDPDRYGSIVRGLKNASLAGRDEWPTNVTEAYNYHSKWEGEEIGTTKTRDYEGVAFGIDGETAKPKGPQPWYAKMTCKNCNKKGHIAALCDNNDKTAEANVQDAEAKEGHEDWRPNPQELGAIGQPVHC